MMQPKTNNLFTQHQRYFEGRRFVYPVLSRRSGGISLGVNLNPDKICNFDCIYCQVDRTTQSETRFVEMEALLQELNDSLDYITSGQIFESEKFQQTPEKLRVLKDIAFSGDGEPTSYRNFDEIIAQCAAVKRQRNLQDVKMVLITNASMFHRKTVIDGLKLLDNNQGEIWAKLDAGTEEYFQQVDRTTINLSQIMDNIKAASNIRPLVIQSIFMKINEQAPSQEELSAYCDRLNEVIASGGQIKEVQVYTIARRPAESYVDTLSNSQVDEIAEMICERTKLNTSKYYGVSQE